MIALEIALGFSEICSIFSPWSSVTMSLRAESFQLPWYSLGIKMGEIWSQLGDRSLLWHAGSLVVESKPLVEVCGI